MNFDDYESLWRAQNSPALPLPALASERDAVIDRVRRESRRFDRTIFWRDAREISISFIMAAIFALSAWHHTENGYVAWGRWIAVALVLGVAIILLRDRRSMPRPPVPEEPMLGQIDDALAGLRHQARILRQVPSNYALPLAVATISFGLDPILRKGGMAALRSPEGAAVVGVSLLVGCFVLWLNRFALRTAIQPKIAELEQLRRGLADPESSSTTRRSPRPPD